LTSDGTAVYPIWSRDGARVFFGLSLTGPYKLFSIAADGSGGPARVVADGFPFNRYPGAWTPDGHGLVFYEMPGDIKLLSLDDTEKITPLVGTRFGERMPDLSPDGRWLAYVSDETGRNEVYVRAFPALGDKRRLSADGGVQPAWSPDGQKLIYLGRPSPDSPVVKVIELNAAPGPRLTMGPPHPLFETREGSSLSMRAYDLTADAKRFVFVHPIDAEPTAPREIFLVQNWFDELKRSTLGNSIVYGENAKRITCYASQKLHAVPWRNRSRTCNS